jgi:hypothetical protein
MFGRLEEYKRQHYWEEGRRSFVGSGASPRSGVSRLQAPPERRRVLYLPHLLLLVRVHPTGEAAGRPDVQEAFVATEHWDTIPCVEPDHY